MLVVTLFWACAAASHARMGNRQIFWFSQTEPNGYPCAEVARPENSCGKVVGVKC